MRLLLLFVLVVPLGAHAGDIKLSIHVRGWWPFGILEKREPLPVSPHHLSQPAPQAKDACTFVAGVRHCPRAEPR